MEEENKEQSSRTTRTGRKAAMTQRTDLPAPPDNLKEAASIPKISEEQKKRFSETVTSPCLKWILILAVGGLLTAAGLFLSVRMIINGVFLLQYRSGWYSYQPESVLTAMNVPEGYVPLYNLGNAAYQKEDYGKAVLFYKQALEKNPSHPKECAIRINLALAMLKEIDFNDVETESGAKTALNQLYAAREILTGENCADPDFIEEGDKPDPDKYHNENAEILKEEIDRKIRELEQQSGVSYENSEDAGSEEEDESEDSSVSEQPEMSGHDRQVQKKLEERQKEAQEEYNESLNAATSEGGGQDGDEEEGGSSGAPAENW